MADLVVSVVVELGQKGFVGHDLLLVGMAFELVQLLRSSLSGLEIISKQFIGFESQSFDSLFGLEAIRLVRSNLFGSEAGFVGNDLLLVGMAFELVQLLRISKQFIK